ncbi:MAG: CARDB domain-containing protein, partial [Tistlia sp.]
VDCDGTVEVDLPAMGASPTVKDVFVELDWMTGSEPTQAALAAVVAAFDQAPPGAGGVITANQGIRLWFDTGNLTDPTASEDGAGPNTCSDGIDNSPGGAEGLADQSDPDCLVGALAFSTLQGGGGLGGGNGFAIGGIPSLDADSDDDGINDFQEAKFDPARGNFDPDRLLAFRYGISGVAGGAPPQFGGQARGNDFLLLGQSAGLLMHELGHTLGLGHGGPEDGNNCKPNYVSVMNYRYQGGITVAGGIGAGQDIDGDGAGDGMILDYSPPRFANGRGFAPLATLDETAWDETVVLDASDSSNFFAWADPSRQLVASLLNALPDWNNDGDTVDQAPPPIDFNTSFWNPAADEGGGAGSCGDGIDNNGDGNVDAADPVCNGNVRCGLPANASNTLHAGADDWSNLAFDPRRFADTDEGDIPAWLDEPTEEEIEFVAQALQTTDLVVSQKIADPDPVAAGQPIVYTTTVENRGPNPASQVVLVDHLPDELVFVEGEPSCTASGATVECALGYLAAGESREVRIVARVRLDLACAPDSQFVALGNSAEARNELGPDLEPGDNSTRVVSQGLCATYEYAAKFVCGTQGSPEDPRLARGRYATTVNVHNPHDEDVYFFKKLALTFPPERQEPGRVRPIGIDRLAYDEALKADCAEARDLIGEDGPGYVEGYLVVQSPRSLDVDAVYTAESQEREGAPPTISIDVEAVDERQRRRGPRPDLVVEPALPEPPFDERFGFQLPEGVPGALFCGDNGPQGGPARTVEAVVRNIGAGDAGPSELRLDFGDGSSASAPVGALPAGDSATVSADIPGSCYATGSCLFDLTADGAATVAETDETNNEASGLCLRPAG